MPPKRTHEGRTKSTVNRSLTPAQAAIFANRSALDKFEMDRNRPFATERGWNLSDFGEGRRTVDGIDTNWEIHLERLGLVRLLTFHQGYIPLLVREFYANATRWNEELGDEYLETRVRGTRIRVTPETFVEMFGLRREYNIPRVETEEMEEYLLREGTPRGRAIEKIGWLKPDYYALSKSVCANLLSHTHDKEFNKEKLKCIWSIARGFNVNAPKIIVLEMINVITTTNRRTGFAFPGIVTEIIKRAGVNTEGFEVGKPRISGLIDWSTVNKALKANKGREQQGEEEEESSEEEEASEGQAGRLITLGRKMDALDVRMTRVEDLAERGFRMVEEHGRMIAEQGRMISQMYYAARARDPSSFPTDAPGPSSS